MPLSPSLHVTSSLLWNQTQTAWLLPFYSGDKNAVMWHQLQITLFIVQISQPSHSAVVGQETQRCANTARRKSAFIPHSLTAPPQHFTSQQNVLSKIHLIVGGFRGKKCLFCAIQCLRLQWQSGMPHALFPRLTTSPLIKHSVNMALGDPQCNPPPPSRP